MKVYKFGGASVKDAEGVKNVAQIIQSESENLIIVISAMGKITNALELLVKAFVDNDSAQIKAYMDEFVAFHTTIATNLTINNDAFLVGFSALLRPLNEFLKSTPEADYDFNYDQIVPYGELASTFIVAQYLNKIGASTTWRDVREVIKTDNTYRDAAINWESTLINAKRSFTFLHTKRYLTQGFLGSTDLGATTTLGREGSDFTAAIISHCLDAEYMAIWKDVPGVLNGDPRWLPNTVKLNEISYHEAIEMTFFGASVIHPKTVKPLQNKQIPLLVKSFIEPKADGTLIKHKEKDAMPPIYIKKGNQIFLTISPRDFSFIIEDNLSDIFALFSKHRIKINLMQNSALNFSACFDAPRQLEALISDLKAKYLVRYNDEMELVTIRHYTPDAIQFILNNKEVIDSQLSRETARYVLKASEWKF